MRSTSSSARIGDSVRVADQQPHVLNGRYELTQAVDSDALRTRYLATDRSLGRTVIVELFSPNVDDAEQLELPAPHLELPRVVSVPSRLPSTTSPFSRSSTCEKNDAPPSAGRP